ncbi:unnamed protein product [Lupinus luteus]|uniref:C2H2-type domain-containing protein n=1 Tax=Lupinus luteus TaxID=3873 RepID=A0AAV1YD18_LUPLU
MNSTKKDQIFGIESSTENDENEESSPSERIYHDNSNINPCEDKGSLPNDSRRGSHFRIKIKASSNNNINCCYMCRKKFPTIKSLCGHMRSHPEREWRGIQPPLYVHDDVVVESSSSNRSSSGVVDVADVDLSGSLCWGWSTTAKRGRKSLKLSSCSNNNNHNSTSAGVREAEQRPMLEGVYELMLLSGVLQCDAGETSEKLMKKGSIVASVESSQKSREEKGSDHGSIVRIDVENRTSNRSNKKKNKKKGTKKMKLDEIGTSMNKLDGIETTKRLYKCSICNESFQCYQALGSHLSNHKMKSKNIRSFVEFESHEHDHNGNTTTMMEAFVGRKSSLEEAKSPQATSHVEKCPKILSFDLNMPPIMDEEEKGIESELIIPDTNLVPSAY